MSLLTEEERIHVQVDVNETGKPFLPMCLSSVLPNYLPFDRGVHSTAIVREIFTRRRMLVAGFPPPTIKEHSGILCLYETLRKVDLQVEPMYLLRLQTADESPPTNPPGNVLSHQISVGELFGQCFSQIQG